MAYTQAIAGKLCLVLATLLCLLAPQYVSQAALVLALISGASHMARTAHSSLRKELAALTQEQTHKKAMEAYETFHHTEIEKVKASQRNRIEKLEDEYAGVRVINKHHYEEKLALSLKLQQANADLIIACRDHSSYVKNQHYSHPTAETARRNAALENDIEVRIRQLLKAQATITCRDNEIARLQKALQQQTLNGQRLDSSCTVLRVLAKRDEKKIRALQRLAFLKAASQAPPTSLPGAATTAPPPAPMVSAQPDLLAEHAEKDTRISSLSTDLSRAESDLSEAQKDSSAAKEDLYMAKTDLSRAQDKFKRADTAHAALEKRVVTAERQRNQAVSDANGFWAQRNENGKILDRLRSSLAEFEAKASFIKISSSHNGDPINPATPTLDSLSAANVPDDALLAPLVSALRLLPSAYSAARTQKFEDMVRDFSARYKSLSGAADTLTIIEPNVLASITASDEDAKLVKPLLNALGEWVATKIMYEMAAETLELAVSEKGEKKWNAAAERGKPAPEWVVEKAAKLTDERLGAVEGKRRRGMVEECGKRMEFLRGQVKEAGQR